MGCITHILSIKLSGNGITGVGMKCIGEGLKNNTSVKELDISNEKSHCLKPNRIGLDGAKFFGREVLRTNKCL